MIFRRKIGKNYRLNRDDIKERHEVSIDKQYFPLDLQYNLNLQSKLKSSAPALLSSPHILQEPGESDKLSVS